jgi:hypothetical protein
VVESVRVSTNDPTQSVVKLEIAANVKPAK